jgi:hypothetical protein
LNYISHFDNEHEVLIDSAGYHNSIKFRYIKEMFIKVKLITKLD